MTARLVWLGKLADLAGADYQDVPLAGPIGWEALLGQLSLALAEALRGDRIRVARNGQLLANKTELQIAPGDEVAFLPPVSGG